MKRTLLLSLLVILFIGLSNTAYAQITVNIGGGTVANSPTGVPTPYGTDYKAFRQQYLILASELRGQAATPGDIYSISFNVEALNNTTPMNNYRIRLKQTTQTMLSNAFETGEYTQVFHRTSFMPTEGWNTHDFSTPFVWNGSSNLLVDIVTDVIVGNRAQNASVYCTETSFNSSLRFQSDTANGDTSATGATLSYRSNMRLSMSSLNLMDMAATSVMGTVYQYINSTESYTVAVRNLSPDPVSDYSVKLYAGDEEIGSTPGTELNSMGIASFSFDWTPTQAGLATLYGKVVMPGDQNPLNDMSAGHEVAVLDDDLSTVEIGDGTLINTSYSMPTTYGTAFRNFRQQFLITADELYSGGAMPGSISAMAFNVSDINQCGVMPNYRIRLKHTAQSFLDMYFESGEYHQAFSSAEYMPEDGWNIHAFQAPFIWDGASNLLVDIVTDITPITARNASVYCTETGLPKSLRFQDHYDPADESTRGTVSTKRSNMRLFIDVADAYDVAAMGIDGNLFPGVNSVSNYIVRVRNVSPTPVSDYTVKLMEVGSGILAEAEGTLIDHLETAEITLPWMPDQVGVTQIYGRVEMPGDENPVNDDSFPITVEVIEESTRAFRIGHGIETTDNVVSPYGTHYRSFRQQFLVKAFEIYDSGGSPGMLSGLAFEVNALNDCTAMSNYRIRLKNTMQEEFVSKFEEGEYTEVFQADSFLPDVGWNIHEFEAPFLWDGRSNLIVEIVTDLAPVQGQFASTYHDNHTGFYSMLGTWSDQENTAELSIGYRSERRSNMCFFIKEYEGDMAAVSLGGTHFPIVGRASDYTLRVMNISPTSLSDYAVKLVDDTGNILAETTGTPLEYLEAADIALSWTPTTAGEYNIYGRVEVPGDEYEANNDTAPMMVQVMDAGNIELQIGDGTVLNSDLNFPTPYGTRYRSFREHFLIRADELYAAGAISGNITALVFDVNSLNTCGAMTNYRIRLKNTELEVFNAFFEPGEYTEVFHANTLTPVLGLNIHHLSTPFYWNGSSNIIVELVANRIPGGNKNASVAFHSTEHFSTIYAVSNDANAEDADRGTCSFNRSNICFIIDAGEVGSLSGSVSSGGFPVSGVQVSIQDTVLERITDADGSYYFRDLHSGDHFATAHKIGYEDLTLPVSISEGVESMLDFDMEASPRASVSGIVAGGDDPDTGLESATISLTGVLNYTATTNAQGQFSISVLTGHSYEYTITRTGYQSQSGTIDVGLQNYNMGVIYLDEIIFTPGQVFACLSADETAIDLSWNPRSDLRVQLGYRVWRLEAGDELDEDSWTQITTSTITDTTFTDSAWQSLPDSIYKWAVKAVYTHDILSEAMFSNAVRLQPNDLSALEVYGNLSPAVHSETTHTVVIKNTGTSAQASDSYSVKLMSGDEELASVPGTAIAVDEEQEIAIAWTPTAVGTMDIYGKVVLPEDSNPANDETVPLNISVMEEGVTAFQIGNETSVNSGVGVPTPYGTYNLSFRQQYLILSSELYASGAAPGLINALAFDVSNINTCGDMPNYRIRLKHTTQTSLTATFETGDYTQVFHHDDFMPVNGWNIHNFSLPFAWNGIDNLLVEIVSDLAPTEGRNASVYHHSTVYNSSLRFHSDTEVADGHERGTASIYRSNMRLFMFIDDIGSLTGAVTEGGFPVPNMLISVEDTPFYTTTDQDGIYSFPYLPAGTYTVTAVKNGFSDVSHSVVIVQSEESVQDFSVSGSPIFELSETSWHFGDVFLGGTKDKVFTIRNAGGGELTIQSITHSGSVAFELSPPHLPATLRTEQTLSLPISFTPALIGEISATFTITDDQDNRYINTLSRGSALTQNTSLRNTRDSHSLHLTGFGDSSLHVGGDSLRVRMPLDLLYKNSIFQTVFKNSELNNFAGKITGIKLYNDFLRDVLSTPVKVWLGSTLQNDLASGWISSNDMTLVFDGVLDFPSGENTIPIHFPEMYDYQDHQNLVLMMNRPMDTQVYSSINYFKGDSIGRTRSRNVYHDSIDYDPVFVIGGVSTGVRPKITFEVFPDGICHIEGMVRAQDGSPLQGVNVNLSLRVSVITDANGMFSINNLMPDDYQISLSHYGYITQTMDITLEERQTLELDITMQEMPKVSIFGTVIASDSGEGIEGAELSLTGYADYSIATNTAGEFVIDSTVYAGNSYEYTLTASGYSTHSGIIEIGNADYDMGIITLDELAFGPTQVVAAIASDNASVSISWSPPDPDAFEIIQSFEGTLFPPMDWSQEVTNSGAPNMYGVRPTWSRFGTAEGISPGDGLQQAGLHWIAEHQDEWLLTPSFTCPPDAYLSFGTYLQMGSTTGDHYYVKVSNDGGESWQILWDGAAQPFALNNYDSPIVIDLSRYSGQQIKLAWHADDGVEAFGMYHNWYIDDIYIGNFVGDRAQSRALTGYNVFRFRSGQEDAENNWVLLNNQPLTATEISDPAWRNLAEGQYRWAIKAVYSADVVSMPTFSNILDKVNTNGTIYGFVQRWGNNQAIAGAAVQAGEYSATTLESGFYSITLPAGSYSTTASHEEYHSITYNNVMVIAGENTTLNFTMTHVSNEDVVEITATALSANYPNPFNPETTISYDIKEPAQVRLEVFNLKGQLVKTLVNDQQASGRYNVIFEARDDRGNKLSSGLYFYRLKAGAYSKTRKMMLIE